MGFRYPPNYTPFYVDGLENGGTSIRCYRLSNSESLTSIRKSRTQAKTSPSERFKMKTDLS